MPEASGDNSPPNWFYYPYQPDPMSRTGRAFTLLAAGGFLSLFSAVGIAAAPFAKDMGGVIALPVLCAPVLGLCAGAMIDGYAMLKELRISLLGRLAVFGGTVAVVVVWTVVAFLVVRPLVTSEPPGAAMVMSPLQGFEGL